MEPTAPLSQRAYAARRGVSHMAVQRAIKSGRLKDSLNDGGQIVDPELADREWERNTDLSRAPGYVKERAATRISGHISLPLTAAPLEGGAPRAILGASLAENNAAKVYWQAKHAELDYREAAGELVPAADVRSELESVFMTCRTRLLGIPSRARAAMPGLTVGDVALIEGLVREALEGLASGELVKGEAA